MTESVKNEWLSPPIILSVVGMLAAFGSFWMSFDGRVTKSELSILSISHELTEHKVDEAARLERIEAKIDRLVERQR